MTANITMDGHFSAEDPGHITLWGRKSSSNVQAVLWCLRELNLPVRRIDAGLTYGVTDTQEYLDMNPNGTVPTIRDGSHPPLWESGAILRYLCNQYAPEEFWPCPPVARATVDMWAEWSKLNIALKFTSPIFWPAFRVPAERRDPVVIEHAVRHFEQNLSIANARLSRFDFLVTDDLTLADIQFGHILYRYFDIDIERGIYPNVKHYYERLCDRPAYQETVMVSYEELRDTL